MIRNARFRPRTNDGSSTIAPSLEELPMQPQWGGPNNTVSTIYIALTMSTKTNIMKTAPAGRSRRNHATAKHTSVAGKSMAMGAIDQRGRIFHPRRYLTNITTSQIFKMPARPMAAATALAKPKAKLDACFCESNPNTPFTPNHRSEYLIKSQTSPEFPNLHNRRPRKT